MAALDQHKIPTNICPKPLTVPTNSRFNQEDKIMESMELSKTLPNLNTNKN